MAEKIAAAASAQSKWKTTSIRDRTRILRAIRNTIALEATRIAEAASTPSHPLTEVLVAEILPFLDACKFLENNAAEILQTVNLGRRERPIWLGRVTAHISREPFGVVAVIAPANYPFFLPAVQTIQAITAGNSVLWKPPAGGGKAAQIFLETALDSGLPKDVLQILPETVEAGKALVDGPIHKVIFTGSHSSGVEVLSRLASRAVPAVPELSGSDAVFVREDADIGLVAKALSFGLYFNQARTCIAPRRVFVPRTLAEPLERALISELTARPRISEGIEAPPEVAVLIAEACAGGARVAFGGMDAPATLRWPCIVSDARPEMRLLCADLFLPILSIIKVGSDEEALAGAAHSAYGLGASVFGSNLKAAKSLAARVRAGYVSVNDLIAPSADPRIPFGGTGHSGYGVTRGAEGLMEMTHAKVVQVRTGGIGMHLKESPPPATLASSLIQMLHAKTFTLRLRGLLGAIRNAPASHPEQALH